MKKIGVVVLILFKTLSFAQDVSKERVTKVLSTLASDEMKGREIGTPENDSAAVYIAKLFKENALDFCTGKSYLVPFEYNGKIAYNVCGIKKGKSDKILSFTGHFDHIGTRGTGTDQIYNGADDNASGVTALVGVADYFKKKKTDFSMMFIAFNGEEKGMKGSTAIANLEELLPYYQKTAALFHYLDF